MSSKTLLLSRTLSPLFSRNYSSLNRPIFYTPTITQSNPISPKYSKYSIFGISKDNNHKNNEKVIEEKESSKLPENEENLKIEELQELICKNEKDLKEMTNKYLYSIAEIENIRKIKTQQVNESRLFAIQNFTRDLLNIADTLEAAVKSVKTDDLKDACKSFTDLFEGVKMTETNLQKVFSNHGLQRISPLGEKFNPEYHESAFLMPGDAPGTVGEVRTIGYLLNGRLLRPSLVGVVREKS
ncbi:GrpE protein-like protein 1, mitochondrial-like [Oopsacas minuta]|uniref:GrpE protein-like protein 1, mitochondrial-like n=1 Tax=Oopsacas minuta TaxID=111878 RepID=A0AAV7JH24_9METZ|nr:GrpE protein-like protein 1, mitochondrial-like [Oopsacas minuta]